VGKLSVGSGVVFVLALTTAARADVDIKRADALFEEGVKLRDVNLEQSCKKFAESLQYNPQAIGTILNVALCDEKLGRIASAYERFSDARDRAKEQNLEDYLKAAEEHLASIGPERCYVAITFQQTALPDTKVVVDDKVVPKEKLGKLALDPGERIIVVSAPGRLPHQSKTLVARRCAPSDKPTEVSIPPLEKSVTVKSSRKTIGKITSAVGVAVLGTGIGIGLKARSSYNKEIGACDYAPSDPEMKEKKLCPPAVQTKIEKARQLGDIGTVVGVVGVAAIGIGAYLWLRAPDETAEPRVTFVPQIAPGEAGVVAVGRF
jgi:hypothetical protein